MMWVNIHSLHMNVTSIWVEWVQIISLVKMCVWIGQCVIIEQFFSFSENIIWKWGRKLLIYLVMTKCFVNLFTQRKLTIAHPGCHVEDVKTTVSNFSSQLPLLLWAQYHSLVVSLHKIFWHLILFAKWILSYYYLYWQSLPLSIWEQLLHNISQWA